jgi:hypothetical protein
MSFTPLPGEQYTIRRKVLKIFGAAFHVYDKDAHPIGFCKQKAFKLREDIRIFTDESMKTELISIQARTILDFSTTYDVTLSDGSQLGSMRRKGLRSTFIRDEWMVFSPDGNTQIATLREVGSFLSFARRYIEFVALFAPQKFELIRPDGSKAAFYRQHFNLFVYRLGISINRDAQDQSDGLDDMMILAMGCLIAAIEGRQSSG